MAKDIGSADSLWYELFKGQEDWSHLASYPLLSSNPPLQRRPRRGVHTVPRLPFAAPLNGSVRLRPRMEGVCTELWSIARLMRFTAGRNEIGLTERQIAYCVEAWTVLCADRPIALDTSEAVQYASRTRFNEAQNTVFLGADALPGDGVDANARLSMLACLAHELAHAERFHLGYRRPTNLPDVLLDEAESSLRASFTSILSPKDREDLVEDARDRLIQWLALRQQEGETDAQS